ncbi:MAG: GYF domain-containing protein [Planctomycetota bacterium]
MQVQGPYDLATLSALAAEGRPSEDTLLRQEQTEEWLP